MARETNIHPFRGYTHMSDGALQGPANCTSRQWDQANTTIRDVRGIFHVEISLLVLENRESSRTCDFSFKSRFNSKDPAYFESIISFRVEGLLFL